METVEQPAFKNKFIAQLAKDNPDVCFVEVPHQYWVSSVSDYTNKIIWIGIKPHKTPYKRNQENTIDTAVLHELGHIRTAYTRKTIIGAEVAAWKWANKYAEKKGYKFNWAIEEVSLSHYYKAYQVALKAAKEDGYTNPIRTAEAFVKAAVKEACNDKRKQRENNLG